MSGLCFYSIIVVACLFALPYWAWRRYNISPSNQIEIAFFVSVFLTWIGAMSGMYSPVNLPQQKRNSAVTVTPLGPTKPSGGQDSSVSALAYATSEGGAMSNERRTAIGSLRGLDGWTAVYDISAHTVYLPNGTKLEAHSGLGARLDNPLYVNERMRGATPPHVYELALREKPFHGVHALRLKPIGDDNIFGRAGLLAHSYMLGPKGDSNGCVAFKNYDAFLRAFADGEVKRLVVVAHLD
jgi:hypothetical protein